MRVKTRKGVFELLPDSWANYRRLYVDVFSVAASLSYPEELFKSAAEAGVNVVAEQYAVELCEAECGSGCAVVTRDYDAALKARRCAVLLFWRGGFWLVSPA